jgi:alkylated DNA nucleotide flippase Atl1
VRAGNRSDRDRDGATELSAEDIRGRILLVSRLLRVGEWTTYGDIGIAASGSRHAARMVGHLASTDPGFANAHRVLGSGGFVVPGQGGKAAAARRRHRLQAEGVQFKGATADQSRRVGWLDLRGRLSEAEEGQ